MWPSAANKVRSKSARQFDNKYHDFEEEDYDAGSLAGQKSRA